MYGIILRVDVCWLLRGGAPPTHLIQVPGERREAGADGDDGVRWGGRFRVGGGDERSEAPFQHRRRFFLLKVLAFWI